MITCQCHSWLPLLSALLLCSRPEGLHAERSAAASDDHPVLLQLRPNGNLVKRHRHRVTASQGFRSHVHRNDSSHSRKTAPNHHFNHFAKVGTWLDKYDDHIDKWEKDTVLGKLKDKAIMAMDKSLEYTMMPLAHKKGLEGMKKMVQGLGPAAKDEQNKEMHLIGDALLKAKGAEAPLVPDSFPVPRPGGDHQEGDNWEPPKPAATLEELQQENERLKKELEEVHQSHAASGQSPGAAQAQSDATVPAVARSDLLQLATAPWKAIVR
jgi:hypothetical protein